METQIATLNFLSLINFSSTDCIERVLLSYYEIEQLAYSGHQEVIALYIEINKTMTYLSPVEVNALKNSIREGDVEGVREGASWIREILQKL